MKSEFESCFNNLKHKIISYECVYNDLKGSNISELALNMIYSRLADYRNMLTKLTSTKFKDEKLLRGLKLFSVTYNYTDGPTIEEHETLIFSNDEKMAKTYAIESEHLDNIVGDIECHEVELTPSLLKKYYGG